MRWYEKEEVIDARQPHLCLLEPFLSHTDAFLVFLPRQKTAMQRQLVQGKQGHAPRKTKFTSEYV